MRTLKIGQIEANIKRRREDVNAQLQEERGKNPRIRRTRTRSSDERLALTEITRASVERAKREGKMKMIRKRTMYYDPTE